MSLRSIDAKGVYKSDRDNILEDFYFPALSAAVRYDRAVGFFSSSTITYAAQALSTFTANGGKMRLIVGAFTDLRDIEAIRRGEENRGVIVRVEDQLLMAMAESSGELFDERFRALAWLVAQGRLDIKVALRPHGMYHDKIGIITDAAGDSFVFAGSANESAQALLPTHNYESIDVFPTWKEALSPYFSAHREAFERLWENKSRGTAVIDVPTAMKERLLEVAQKMDTPPNPAKELAIMRRVAEKEDPEVLGRLSGPHLPESIAGQPFQIRQHQRDALNAWREKGEFVGIFDLATGAGKTITACYAIVQLWKSIPGLVVVIAVPYQNLADQWCDILEQFGIYPIRCYVSRTDWESELQQTIHDVQMAASAFAAIVVVNRTLKSPVFQEAIAQLPAARFLWIGDECHHHSSATFDGFLPKNARYRIGLSATPHHYVDQERNERLSDYYGDVVFTYSLKQAIREGVLTPYEYYPHIVALTSNEAEQFAELSDSIARAFAREQSSNTKPSQGLTGLLMQRARLISSAANKLPTLEKVLAGQRPQNHTLFYCGDGTVEAEGSDEQDASESRQIEALSQLIGRLGWRASRFTSREPRRERDSILSNFRYGLIDAMVAIKCLDEGIDVPACNTAYILASSRDPRQFIQRRGRILRKYPGKEFAKIHDFVVVLPDDYEDHAGHARKLIRSELQRVAEFANLSLNSAEAYGALRPILNAYDLEHVI